MFQDSPYSTIHAVIPSGQFFFTGSRYLCNPPTTDTDQDVVTVFDKDLNERLIAAGFEPSKPDDGSMYPNSSVAQCYRKDAYNIIAVTAQKDYDNWRKASALAMHMNLLEKHQRVALFQFVTEGKVRGTVIEY